MSSICALVITHCESQDEDERKHSSKISKPPKRQNALLLLYKKEFTHLDSQVLLEKLIRRRYTGIIGDSQTAN